MTRLALAAMLLLGACGQQTCPAVAPPIKPPQPQSSLWPDRAPPIVMPRLAPQPAPEARKRAVKVKAAKAKPKAKPKIALPAWCSRVPAGTTIAQIEAYGKLTAPERQQAQACLKSKRT